MEMETIGKKVAPEAKVNMDRKCENCACFNGKDWCKLHQHSTRAINYGCKTHLTKEEMDVKIKNAQEYLEAQDGIRVNYMLTLMFAMVSASYQIMCKGETMLGKLIGGKDWRFERKKALKDMMNAIAKIQSLYSTYFEKDYKEMMSDYGREEFDHYTYDGFQMFSGDLLMLGLTYFEHGYRNNEVLHQIIEHIRTSYPNQLNLFPPEFVKQFEIKSND
jgi:hypothetical protein